MNTLQQKHIIPIKKASRPLFGSGAEKTLPYLLSDDFVDKAAKSGVVERIDHKTNLAVLKYDDDTRGVIDLSPVMSKNSNGGFFLKNVKNFMLQEGDKFEKGQIIAKNDQYFLGDNANNVTYSTGRMTKVAVASADYTYEDSSLITDALAEDLTFKITMKKTINLGVNANIEQMVKVGDKIKTGQSLMVFEESFEDESLNALLMGLGDEFNEFVQENSKNKLKSKYTGEIVDIVIYYNRDIEEFQPSVQKILKDYIKGEKVKKQFVKNATGSNDVSGIHMKPINKQKPGKIKGEDVDGLLIEIYIEYLDKASVGD